METTLLWVLVLCVVAVYGAWMKSSCPKRHLGNHREDVQ